MNKIELNKYYREINWRLAITFGFKWKEYYKGFIEVIEEHIANSPETTKEELYECYGTPKAIADNYINQLAPNNIKHMKRNKAAITWAFGIFILLIIILFIVRLVYNDIDVLVYTAPEKEITHLASILLTSTGTKLSLV